MTHSARSILQLLFVALTITSCSQPNKKYLDIHSNTVNRGHQCYILWTTDTTKCRIDNKLHLTFDSNNVVYVHRQLRDDRNSIRILDELERDISTHMINVMGDVEDSYLTFYNPTGEEIKSHPYFDEYYRDKLLFPKKEYKRLSKSDLIQLGYKPENKN